MAHSSTTKRQRKSPAVSSNAAGARRRSNGRAAGCCPPSKEVLSVRAKCGTLRRCGRRFGVDPTYIPIATLQSSQREIIEHDPDLIVLLHIDDEIGIDPENLAEGSA